MISVSIAQMKPISQETLEKALELLGGLMAVRNRPAIHLVVCGGSALIALGLVHRTTQDVDVLATLESGRLRCARPLPDWLADDAEAVRSEISLPRHWLNDGPADEDLFRLGLPEGLGDRLSWREFGPELRVGFISRFDQIHFKLFAAADQGGRHLADLQKLGPTSQELLAAARWVFSHDASEAFRQLVFEVLRSLGQESLHESL
jgi:hypothetical protein